MFLPQYERPSFTRIQNHMKNYCSVYLTGGKQWQIAPKNLPRMQHTSHTGRLTGLWFLPKLALWLNTNYYYYYYILLFLDSKPEDKRFCIEWWQD
jgi:hypothetical protein